MHPTITELQQHFIVHFPPILNYLLSKLVASLPQCQYI
jgi:hypothetical protein